MVAAKPHSKKLEWPFSPDPRQQTLLPSDDEECMVDKQKETKEIKILARAARDETSDKSKSKWGCFSASLAETAYYQSQRLYYRYLNQALDGPCTVNLHAQFDLPRKNFQEKGHTWRTCPEPKTCFICQQEGHIAAKYPHKSESTQEDTIASLIALASTQGGEGAHRIPRLRLASIYYQ